MEKCKFCGKIVWWWQKQGHPLLKPIHYDCWFKKYEERLVFWSSHYGENPNSLLFWDDVLISPSELRKQIADVRFKFDK